MQTELKRVRGVTVRQRTIRIRLKKANFTRKRPSRGLKLTAAHRLAQFQCVCDNLNSISFSDESRICLYGSDRKSRIYRCQGEGFSQCCFSETVSYGGGSVMMWAGISIKWKTGGSRRDDLTAGRYPNRPYYTLCRIYQWRFLIHAWQCSLPYSEHDSAVPWIGWNRDDGVASPHSQFEYHWAFVGRA